ncbi:unnamed protein product [Caenorhabditis angaria]|uniref:C2H2-type domain-containing protein n=1 Tax=Caenorhabditis angaria TaxID=860376 RepID=A0A9P1ICP5_9PELO|nr:unnamed protein product [Caenorhabditis angaria]
MCRYHLLSRIGTHLSLPVFLSETFDSFGNSTTPIVSKSQTSIKNDPTFLHDFNASASNVLEPMQIVHDDSVVRPRRNRKDRQKFSRWRHKEYQCDECERMFTLKHNLQNHVIQYHMGCRKLQKPCSSSKCDVCGKIYSTPSVLAEHLLDSHNIHIKKEECSQCDEKFLTCSALQRHIKSEHASKSKTCTFEGCDNKFKFMKDLNEHIKSCHKQEFFCTICHLSFTRLSSKKKHEQAHMGPRLKRERRRENFIKEITKVEIKMEDDEVPVAPRRKFRPELEAVPIIRKTTKKISKDEILAKIK